MLDPNESDLKNICRELSGSFHGDLSWKWDSRFEIVLAEFSVDNKGSIRSILERYLSIVWDSSNIGKAPDTVQMIASHLGGLRSGQLLFASDPNQDAFLFVPGGPGATEKPSLFASRHSTRNHPMQRWPNSLNCSKAGSDSKPSPFSRLSQQRHDIY
jgi:hypothetical protein